MISKKYRLREYEVTRVFKKGRPSFGAFWTMNYLEARNAKNHRMTVTVTRKHDKRAVARNRYRRGLYDGLLPLLNVKGGTLKVGDISSNGENVVNPVNGVNKNASHFLCVFTLKKGLKLTEKKIPEAWINDAWKLFEKVVRPTPKNEQPPRSL